MKAPKVNDITVEFTKLLSKGNSYQIVEKSRKGVLGSEYSAATGSFISGVGSLGSSRVLRDIEVLSFLGRADKEGTDVYTGGTSVYVPGLNVYNGYSETKRFLQNCGSMELLDPAPVFFRNWVTEDKVALAQVLVVFKVGSRPTLLSFLRNLAK